MPRERRSPAALIMNSRKERVLTEELAICVLDHVRLWLMSWGTVSIAIQRIDHLLVFSVWTTFPLLEDHYTTFSD